MMEYWNAGMMSKKRSLYVAIWGLPILPCFHDSIIPVLFQRPFLQPLIICRAADPFTGFLVEEEWNTSAVPLIILPHQFGIGFIMQDLKLCHLDPLFVF